MATCTPRRQFFWPTVFRSVIRLRATRRAAGRDGWTWAERVRRFTARSFDSGNPGTRPKGENPLLFGYCTRGHSPPRSPETRLRGKRKKRKITAWNFSKNASAGIITRMKNARGVPRKLTAIGGGKGQAWERDGRRRSEYRRWRCFVARGAWRTSSGQRGWRAFRASTPVADRYRGHAACRSSPEEEASGEGRASTKTSFYIDGLSWPVRGDAPVFASRPATTGIRLRIVVARSSCSRV